MHLIHLIAAARPNFMKIAPLFHALSREPWANPQIIHTGQHYDLNMSDAFFQDLRLPPPHIHLGVGSGTHAEQTGRVMIAYEKCLMTRKPDLVIIVITDSGEAGLFRKKPPTWAFHVYDPLDPTRSGPLPLIRQIDPHL